MMNGERFLKGEVKAGWLLLELFLALTIQSPTGATVPESRPPPPCFKI